MFTIMNGQAPVYLVNMFTQTNSMHDHNTCGGTNIRVEKYNISTGIGQRTFAYRGTKVWNNIPELIKNATSVECFKSMFLKHVRKDVLIGLHEYVECFNMLCNCVCTCVNGKMAH